MKEMYTVKCSWWKNAGLYLAFIGVLWAKQALALGLPPLITVPPIGVSVQNGGTAIITATVGLSLTKLEIKWCLDGKEVKKGTVSSITVPITGTTVTTLTIPNVSAADVGSYTIKAENSGGEVTSSGGLLVILGNVLTNVSILPSNCGMTASGFQLNLIKPAGSNCVIDASTDLSHWTPVYTNSVNTTNVSFVDVVAKSMNLRYYRVRLQ